MKKELYQIKVWENIYDYSDFCSGPYIHLGLGSYFGLCCGVHPNKITFSTQQGGGHGEGRWSDSGRTGQEWLDLLNEAIEIQRYYFS